MSLPIRATLQDVSQTCGYLANKPTGATVKDIAGVLGKTLADHRRISALQSWGLIEAQTDGKLKVSDDGRLSTKGEGERREVLRRVIRRIPAYLAIVERAAHRREDALSANDVSAHWHAHFKDEAAGSDELLKEQAISFFQIAEGSGLGTMIVGRRGQPTRFSFSADALRDFVGVAQTEAATTGEEDATADPEVGGVEEQMANVLTQPAASVAGTTPARRTGQGIFVAHGKNKKPLEQLKRILDQFRITYRVATDEPSLGRPIGTKVRETMEACNCAILIFTADEEFKNKDSESIWRPSENVVYELGAAGYLYDNRLVILKEEGVTFPSNFRDIGYISFEKDRLEAKAMDVLKELIGFGIVKVST